MYFYFYVFLDMIAIYEKNHYNYECKWFHSYGFDLRNSLMSLQNSNQNMVCSSDSDHGSSGFDSNYTTFEIYVIVSENRDRW